MQNASFPALLGNSNRIKANFNLIDPVRFRFIDEAGFVALDRDDAIRYTDKDAVEVQGDNRGWSDTTGIVALEWGDGTVGDRPSINDTTATNNNWNFNDTALGPVSGRVFNAAGAALPAGVTITISTEGAGKLSDDTDINGDYLIPSVNIAAGMDAGDAAATVELTSLVVLGDLDGAERLVHNLAVGVRLLSMGDIRPSAAIVVPLDGPGGDALNWALLLGAEYALPQ